MAVVYIQEFAIEGENRSTANYDWAQERLEAFYELHDVRK